MSVQPDPAPTLKTTGTMDSFSVPVIEVTNVSQKQKAAPPADSPRFEPLEGSVVALPDTKPAFHQELEKQVNLLDPLFHCLPVNLYTSEGS